MILIKLFKTLFMKKLSTLFMFLVMSMVASAQLVITEISYNPPESGADSLEYIEIYNASDIEVNLNGYIIADNNSDTLKQGVLPAGGYAVFASNASAVSSVFGVSVMDSIPNIGLKNSGETITIKSPSGDVIDEVTFDDEGEWPDFSQGADGGGASIELCNLEADNSLGKYWKVSTNVVDTLNSKPLAGTPGKANSQSCTIEPDHIVEVSSNVFTPKDLQINVGETVRWVNTGGFHNVNGSQSVYPDNPESFTSGDASSDAWTFEYTFTIPGRYDYQCDPHASLDMKGSVTVMGPAGPPTYAIDDVNNINDEGVADSLNVVCSIVGVAHGINFNPNGLQFTLIQNGAGIGLFSSEKLGYDYQEGDELKVTGKIDQYNGLIQIKPTEIEVVSSDNDLMEYVAVTTLDESTESLPVMLSDMNFTDASQWKGDGSSFNVTMASAMTGEEITLRIDRDTELANQSIPVSENGTFLVRGIGGQFDNNAPFTAGYQLFPITMADFDSESSSSDPTLGAAYIYPNPVGNQMYLDTELSVHSYIIYAMDGKVVMAGDYAKYINVSTLQNAQYIAVYQTDSGSIVRRFTKK